MKKFKGIFAVSFIAMMTVGIANANIASQGYVDQEVGTRLSAISGSTSGTGNVVTSVTASGGTVTVTKGINAEVISNKTTTIATADSASDTKYPSEKAVATALAGKADIEDIQDAITVDSALSSSSTNPVQNKVINAALDTKQNANTAVEVATAGTAVGSATQPVYVDNTGVVRAGNSIPTVNNATLTIQKNGASVGTFTANASQNATVNISVPTKTSELNNDSGFVTSADLPQSYTLPVATSAALGGVKSAGDITVSAAGAVTVNSATKATQDGSGNNIVNTYATKEQLNALDSKSTGTGAVVTAVTQTDGKVTVTNGNVKIPVGGESATTYATIWVE